MALRALKIVEEEIAKMREIAEVRLKQGHSVSTDVALAVVRGCIRQRIMAECIEQDDPEEESTNDS